MGQKDTFDLGYGCTEGNPGGALANQVPVIVAYVAAFYVKRHFGVTSGSTLATMVSTWRFHWTPPCRRRRLQSHPQPSLVGDEIAELLQVSLPIRPEAHCGSGGPKKRHSS
jgi:hypothetical protein